MYILVLNGVIVSFFCCDVEISLLGFIVHYCVLMIATTAVHGYCVFYCEINELNQSVETMADCIAFTLHILD